MNIEAWMTIAAAIAIGSGCGGGGGSGGPTSDPAPSTGGGGAPALAVDPAPANGFQLMLDPVPPVPPAASLEYCTWTDKILDAPIAIKSTKVFQSKGGHHAVLYYTSVKQPAGTTRVCTEDDMLTLRYGSASAGESAETTLPGDLVVPIPKGAQLVVNHHYLNAGVAPIVGQTAMNVRLADPGAPTTPAGALAVLDTGIKVPVGRSEYDVKCTVKQPLAIWQLLPHLHQWGEHATLDVVQGGQSQRLVDVPWDPSYTFHPPVVTRSPDAPLNLAPGDEIHIGCAWNNTTGQDMAFGLEMCVAFGQTVDAHNLGNLECNGGSWGPF
jgi:hypothetical protein